MQPLSQIWLFCLMIALQMSRNTILKLHILMETTTGRILVYRAETSIINQTTILYAIVNCSTIKPISGYALRLIKTHFSESRLQLPQHLSDGTELLIPQNVI